MKSLIAPKFTEPSGYEISSTENPTIQLPTHILVQVHAASINPHDTIMASGRTKAVMQVTLPYPIGLDFSGTVIAVGDAVNEYALDDAVYGFVYAGGAAATHILLDIAAPSSYGLAKVPTGINMIDAASLPAVAATASTALAKADVFFASEGGVKGKTVFVPAALSGTGAMGLQIAKNVYGCTTFTTVSTSKLSKIDQWLGAGTVDRAVDYTKEDVVKALGKGTVDFVFDTTGAASDYLPLLRRGGFLLSIARLPPGKTMKSDDPDAPAPPRMMCIGRTVLDAQDAAFRTWAKTMHSVTYVYQKTEPAGKDILDVSRLVEERKLRAVVGRTVKLEDIEDVRAACSDVYKGKGGIGKLVLTMVDNASTV